MRIERITDIDILNNVVENSDSFYKKEEIVYINGKTHNFAIYNYTIANIEDFKKFAPHSFELRGLTVNLDTGQIFPSYHKFFNQNENNLVQDSLFTRYNNVEVVEKLDGSLIQPIIVENDLIFKTKGTFNSEQANYVNKYFNNIYMKKFIFTLYNQGYYPLFEFVAPHNQIVLNYDNEFLYLIGIRDINTWKYFSQAAVEIIFNKYASNEIKNIVKLPKIYNYTENDLLNSIENDTDIEGYVVKPAKDLNIYTDIRKYKTKWYFKVHKLIAPDNLMEHNIIENILDETIDDILSSLSPSSIKRQEIEKIISKIDKYIKDTINTLKYIHKKHKKTFDKKPKKFNEIIDKYDFKPVIYAIIKDEKFDEDKALESIKTFIRRKTNSLKKAQEFLKQI